MTRQIVVAGFFDMFHSGHLTFLEEASCFGEFLTVIVGCDKAALKQKNLITTCSEKERAAIVGAIHCVDHVIISPDTDSLNFLSALVDLKKDNDVIFIANKDGHTIEKETVCKSIDVKYCLLDGMVNSEFSGRRSSDYRRALKQIPYRINLGGFLDQPEITKHRGGLNIVCSITPEIDLESRSGVATSTRETIKRIFNNQYPHWIDNKKLAEIIFAVENPPCSYKYLSGTTDSIGITTTGITKLGYGKGKVWPEYIDQIMDRDKIEWLESVLWLKQTYQRPSYLSPFLETTKANATHIYGINEGAIKILTGIEDKGIGYLQCGLTKIYTACRDMVGQYATQRTDEIFDEFGGVVCGSGGGGYMLIASETKPYEDCVSFKIN